MTEKIPAKSKLEINKDQDVQTTSKRPGPDTKMTGSESPKLRKNPGMYDLLSHIKCKINGIDSLQEDECQSKSESVIRVQNFDRGDEPTV